MKKQGSMVLALVSCLCVFTLGSHAKAVESLDSLGGGSNAADYQPPTDNPQNVPTSNLQTTTTGLQPVSGQSTVNQQNLNGVSNLQVLGTQGGAANPNTTSIAVTKDETSWRRPVGVVVGLLALGAVIYAVLRSPKPKGTAIQKPSTETPNAVAPLSANPQPKKPKKSQAKKLPKKKTTKKRKAKK